MSTRKCITCAGTGYLWGTPPLIVDGGLQSDHQGQGANIDNSTPGWYGVSHTESDSSSQSRGLTVTCWRCVGKGYVPADRQDEGETNG